MNAAEGAYEERGKTRGANDEKRHKLHHIVLEARKSFWLFILFIHTFLVILNFAFLKPYFSMRKILRNVTISSTFMDDILSFLQD